MSSVGTTKLDRRGHLRQQRDRVDREHAILDRAHDGYQARLGLLGGGGLLALVLREFERHLPKRDRSRGRLVLGEPLERGSRLEQRGRERDHPCAALGHRRCTPQRDGGAEAVAGEAHGALEAPQAVDGAEHGRHVAGQRVQQALRRRGVPEAEQVDDGDVVGAGERFSCGNPALGGVLEPVEQHERLAAPAAPRDVELADLVAHDLLGDLLGHVPQRHVVGGQAVDGADLHVGLEPLERGRLADLDDRVAHADRVDDRHRELGEVVDPRGRVDGVREVLAHDLPVRGDVLGVKRVLERRFAHTGRDLVEHPVLLLRTREPLPQPLRDGLVEHLEAVALPLHQLGRQVERGVEQEEPAKPVGIGRRVAQRDVAAERVAREQERVVDAEVDAACSR